MDRDEEKDLYIKAKIKDGYIPEKIDDLFNNSAKLVEDNKPPKKNQVIFKRIVAFAACAVIALGGGNIYATTQGYDNIFFMIKELVSPSGDIKGKEEILLDRDITISYKYIEIAKGIKLSINNLLVKDNEAKLYLTLDENESDLDITPFTYIVRDENGNELCRHKGSEYRYVYTPEVLTLENFKQDTKKLELEMLQKDSTTLVKIIIDLENKEIEVIGNEKEVEKISEQELKQYLSIFSLLNYNDENLDVIPSREALYNERNLMIVREIDRLSNKISIYDGLTEDLQHDVLDTEVVHDVIESFTDLKVEKDGLMKLGDIYAKKEKVKGKLSYIDMPTYGKRTGLCLEIKDIMYSQGIYTVTFTYCYPEYTSSKLGYKEGVEDLPVYEMTIGLTINDDQTYFKYHVSTWMESQLIKEGKEEESEEVTKPNKTPEIEDNKDNSDKVVDESIRKFVGVWKIDYAMRNERFEEPLSNIFSTNELFIEIKEDGTYSEYYPSHVGYKGTFKKVDDNTIELINSEKTEELSYSKNNLGEIVISRKHTGDNNIIQYFTQEKNDLKAKFVGIWNRTFNVDHEESGEYMLAIQSDGTFLEQQLSKITNEGTYELVQENGWNKIKLKYPNGEEHVILYANTQEPVLHYSAGQQVFKKSETISSFDIFENE